MTATQKKNIHCFRSATKTDTTSELQGVSGGVAVDVYSELVEGHTTHSPYELFVDDIVVTPLP